MAVDEGFSVTPATAVPTSGLDLAKIASGRVVEARVASLVEGIVLVASRHGTLQIDRAAFGDRLPAVGDTVRLQVQAVDGGGRPAVTVVEHTPAVGEVAKPAVTSGEDPVLVLARAVRAAAATQTGLAPLYATLAGLAAAPEGQVPVPVRALVAQLMGNRLADATSPTAEAVRRAFLGSGVFLESRLTAAPERATAADDLKGALHSLRAALQSWVGGASTPPGTTAVATGGGEPPVATSVPREPANRSAASTGPGAGGDDVARGDVVRPGTSGPLPSSGDAVVRGALGRLAGAAYGAVAPQTPAARGSVATTGSVSAAGSSGSPQAPPPASTAPTPTPTTIAAAKPSIAGAAVDPTTTSTFASRSPTAAVGAALSTSPASADRPTGPSGPSVPSSVPPPPPRGVTPSATVNAEAAVEDPSMRGGAVTGRAPREIATSPPGPGVPASPTTGASPAGTIPPPRSSPPFGGPSTAARPGPSGNLGPVPSAGPVSASPSAGRPTPDAAEPPSPSGPAASWSPSAGAVPSSPAADETARSSDAMPAVAAATADAVPSPSAPSAGVAEDDAVSALLKVVVRGLEIAGSLTATRASEAGEAAAALAGIGAERELKPPPPRRGQAPRGQAALPAEAVGSGGVEDLARRALERTEGALSRILLEQFAALDRRPDDPARPAENGLQRSWTVEMPLATSGGTGVVQMTVERDGGRARGEGAAAAPAWRVRFSLDVEPLGPVHVQIGLAGDKLAIGLWAERPDAAAQLGGDVGRLQGALEAAAIPVESIHLATGRPASGGAPTTAGRLVDLKL